MSLANRIKAANKVLLIGNGGSMSSADHICNDLNACGIAAFVCNPATFSAFANDHGYSKAFRLWVHVCGRKGDMLIALSGSGRSPNILEACEEAERVGMDVHREFGATQGLDMQSAEERQIALGHDLMRELKGRQA